MVRQERKRGAAYRIKRAHILLAVDADGSNRTDRQAARAYRCLVHTVEHVRRRLVKHGLCAARARKVDSVGDSLDTHKPTSLCEAFEPKEARRLLQRLAIHCTPHHGSWLNVAEGELHVFARQCMVRRIADVDLPRQHATAWSRQRCASQESVDRRFTTHDASKKLKRLDPQIQMTGTTRPNLCCPKRAGGLCGV
ncbi:MAG: transposase [Candidatus Hydrogenedentes bacterium]|nr:transposase [Candidatus Hydrogenedentota bacterium]